MKVKKRQGKLFLAKTISMFRIPKKDRCLRVKSVKVIKFFILEKKVKYSSFSKIRTLKMSVVTQLSKSKVENSVWPR